MSRETARHLLGQALEQGLLTKRQVGKALRDPLRPFMNAKVAADAMTGTVVEIQPHLP